MDINSINKACLIKDPFRYALIAQSLPDDIVDELLLNLPQDNYFRSAREFGSDKTYNVINYLLLELGTLEPKHTMASCWLALVKELKSKEYINTLSTLLEEDLSECHQEITLKRYGHGDYISAHTDKDNVRATHMIFLNKEWNEAWGGELCFLLDENTIFKKFLPISGYSVAFVRSENSWHSVNKILVSDKERIAIQVAFWNIAKRTVLPGRIEENVVLD